MIRRGGEMVAGGPPSAGAFRSRRRPEAGRRLAGELAMSSTAGEAAAGASTGGVRCEPSRSSVNSFASSAMSTANLSLYLNDHLAGSVGARELLAHLQGIHRGDPWSEFFAEVDAEVGASQEKLRELMRRIGAAESSVRQTAAWLGEKLSRFKLGTGGGEEQAMSLFESLEALHLGTVGQSALWNALAEVARLIPAWTDVPFDQLAREARSLSDRLDVRRLELARRVLGPDEPIAPALDTVAVGAPAFEALPA